MTDASTSPVPAARPVIDEADIEAAVRVLRSGMVVQGPEVAAFEHEFGELVEGRHCVAVNSGTSALHLTLLALGIGPGDEVVVPSFSFAATANAVRLVGADPVFVDIAPDTFTIDPAAVAAAIGPRTAAVMPVHLYGLPADMRAITSLADKAGIAVVEDAAQAHAAAIDGRPVGAWGAAGCFSFYPTKNMHSLEGGMVSTGDEALARALRLLRNQGMERRYENEIVGANVRLTDVAAAVGRSQLVKLPGWTERRREHAATLDDGLGDVAGLTVPQAPAGYHHVYHQYTVRIAEDRDGVQERLLGSGVGCAVYYPTPIHRLPAFRTADGYPDPRWDLPETERATREVLSLPVFPTLTDSEVARVVDGVTTAVGDRVLR